MTEKSFIRADEVAEELDVSKSYAYKVIKQLNDELSVKKTLSRTSDETIESKDQEITLDKLKSGVKYYLRLAALSSCSYNSTLKRYNYSEIFEFVAP